MKIFLAIISCILLFGCTGYPPTLSPVENFEINRYLGKWYEVARLDHSFERGLSKVTAEYSLNMDGSVKVVNRGYSIDDDNWKQATGNAKFVNRSDTGYLKVSFFGPFYGAYVIFEIEDHYDYAFISGPSTNYLWLLSRSPIVDDEVLKKFITRATEAGFNTENLIVVEH